MLQGITRDIVTMLLQVDLDDEAKKKKVEHAAFLKERHAWAREAVEVVAVPLMLANLIHGAYHTDRGLIMLTMDARWLLLAPSPSNDHPDQWSFFKQHDTHIPWWVEHSANPEYLLRHLIRNLRENNGWRPRWWLALWFKVGP